MAQTRVRLAGEIPDGATRVVSLHDLDARPIRKGRLGRPVEFGYKAQVVDNADGIVVDYMVVKGNPPDAPDARPRRWPGSTARFGPGPQGGDRRSGLRRSQGRRRARRPRASAKVADPAQGHARAPPARTIERGPGFSKLIKWRTGCEGRIS